MTKGEESIMARNRDGYLVTMQMPKWTCTRCAYHKLIVPVDKFGLCDACELMSKIETERGN